MRKIFVFLFVCSALLQAAAQNVGIGTNTPAAKLQVAGNVAIDSGLHVNARNVWVPLLIEGSPVNNFLDQNTPQHNTGLVSYDPAWQSFTAGASGTLVQVDLYFRIGYGYPRVVSIYEGTGTQGTLLQSVALGNVNPDSWKSITGFSVPLIKGQTYTIHINQNIAWGYATNNPYSGGISNVGSSSDYAFRTIMDNVNDQLLRIGHNGNLGLGISVPTERLEVKGNIKSSGKLIAGDGAVVTGNLDISGFITQLPAANLILLNNWQNYGETYGNAKYSIDKQSVVRLSGLVKNGYGPVIAQLPTDLRPVNDLIFTVVSGTGFARLDVKTNGNVQLMGSYSNLYVSLDGIAFRVD